MTVALHQTGTSEQALRRGRRRERAMWRECVRGVTNIPRVRGCGSTTHTGTGGPTLRITGTGEQRIAGYAGLVTCGSVWACPVCAARVASQRSNEIADVMRKVLESGGSASMITLTMRHHAGHRLADCWTALGYAWSRVTSGKGWVADQDTANMLGWVKVVEATHGDNGWHLHLHVLLCWDRPVSLEHAEAVGARMWTRWAKALNRRNFQSWAHSGGLDVRMATLETNGLGDYFTKLARELTASHSKDSRTGRTPFAILRDIASHARADDVELWWEWERASHDRRQLTWSRGTRDLRLWAGLGRERSDEEIAAEELGGEDVLALPAETWQVLRRTVGAVQLLDATEHGGIPGATVWLRDRGLSWIMTKRVPSRGS